MLKADYKGGSNEIFKHESGNVLARLSYNTRNLQVYSNFVEVFPMVRAFHIFLKDTLSRALRGKNCPEWISVFPLSQSPELGLPLTRILHTLSLTSS